MPTFDLTDTFRKDHADLDPADLDPADKKRFRSAIGNFIEDLAADDRGFRPGLRVKGIQAAAGIFEMTWARDGRATFEYGDQQRPGESHVIWRRVGTHDIFRRP